ncbi:hypothetical protein J2W39_005792 [Variovorax paradoxus]|uniref:Uncharacterized protein n=1 Tax=Variovorax paradoxus TaxID=34073 RepID=A0AAW8EN99_VARPD|nr:hypothetical protein [Variovorax paradoxus]
MHRRSFVLATAACTALGGAVQSAVHEAFTLG